MDTLTPPSPAPLGIDGAAEGPRVRLAIVSTTNKLCGIAAYTAALERNLGRVFELTLFDLDQYLLRGCGARLRRSGDRHIAEICAQLGGFDAVNLQLEHGTLGRTAKDIYRRFCLILAAAPQLSVTFHTLPPPVRLPVAECATALLTLKFREARRALDHYRRGRVLGPKLGRRLQRGQRAKPISAIVHTRRNGQDVHHIYGLDHVLDHPLTFLSPAEADSVHRRATRRHFPILDRIPGDAKLVGTFGFLNDYKGLSTAIRALHHLPDDHHLLVFGGIHPNEIVPGQPIHPFLSTLYDEAYIDASPYDRLSAPRSDNAPRLNFNVDRGLAELIGPHPRDLAARIHFMGALADEDFLVGMAICDAVVFPYLEVGQSASGPITQALELGCRIIASRTHAFLGFADYHPGAIEFFDIGNYLELAERIRARRQFPPGTARRRYTVDTNQAIYLAANGRLAPRRVSSAAETRIPVPAVQVR
jgi:glycosyltransferase involved in cell wall biosynthesis